jgi:GNAT superfamily N-acetyltransferase
MVDNRCRSPPGIAKIMSTPALRLIDRQLTSDIDRLQAVLEGAPGYSLAVEGRLPTPNAAIEVLDALPPGKGHSDKFVYEIAHDSEAVGCLEMVRGYPEADIAFIGLLLFQEGAQRRGFGPQVLRLAEGIGTGWQCRALRIAVIDTNPRAFNFWKREGFVELLRKPAMDFAGQAIVMERALPAAAIV